MAILTGIRRDKALAAYLTERLATPFEWGKHDCCLFVGGWLELLTGEPWIPEQVTWNDAKSAARYIKKTFKTLEKGLADNFTRIPPDFAFDGDLTIHEGTLFIFTGSHIVSVGEGGLAFLNRSVATRAYCLLEG